MNQPIRVLLVENDTLIADLFSQALDEMGFDVCAVESSEEGAIRAAETHRPNLMIVDAQLASGSGVAAVNHILSRQSIAHLFITGSSKRPDGVGQDILVMVKPFSVDDLKKAIETTLSKK